ncbi:hypothetical protein ACFL5G_04970 [Candidatus Margulisiibacteriota bacterium]
MIKNISIFIFVTFIFTGVCCVNNPVLAQEEDDYFLMEDFEEPIPEFVKETSGTKTSGEKAEEEKRLSGGYSVKNRTYLSLAYGQTAFAGGSALDSVLKDENTYFKDTYNWTKTPFATPINSGLTGGIEVKKGWSDNVMLGLAVYSTVGVSPEKTIRDATNELVASAKYDITTTFINAYLYGPMSKSLEYYVGVGIGVGSGYVQYNEDFNNNEFESKVSDKASGAQFFIGMDWRLAEKFILETRVFYRAMELRNVSLTGGGLTLGLVVPF